ncbi:MAG: helix-turn-helix domain-containing protein, partial [Candidatus Cybelea sp.]
MENEGRATVSSDFGALLRRHRLAAGLSQQTLAERARMSVDGISALERGYRKTPQFETVALLAGALALSEEHRREFVAAAQPKTVRGRGSVTVGPWPSAGSANLPLALTRFIGRGAELDEIAALLREHRFVTLTGVGGVGKTQTALRAATAFSDATETSVCFVGFAPMNDPSLVATAIANALGVQEVPNHPLVETLVAFLKNKTILLVLDNCEHVIAGAATLADSLLHGCPNLRILATSRERLQTGGERTYRLASLHENDAIALFADRAEAADAHFALTDKNRTIAGEVCQRLSGIPLAIELAAAWVTVLPLPALAKALDDRFVVLVGGERTASPRQQTMRAAIDWSYDLLTAPEQRLFERLSVFAGGCTIGAATAVCQGEEMAANDVLPLISSLVSKSLVEADLEGDEPRYRLLEPTRAFALEKLEQRGNAATVGRLHAQSIADLADRAYESSWTAPPRQWLAQVRAEFENGRSAINWALSHDDIVLAARVVAGFSGPYGHLGGYTEGRRWLSAVLDKLDANVEPLLTARVMSALSWVTFGSDAAETAQRAVELSEHGNDPALTASGLARLAFACLYAGNLSEAEAAIGRALRLLEEKRLTHSSSYVNALNISGCIAGRRQDSEATRQTFEKALALATALGNDFYEDTIRGNMAEGEFQAGNAERALELVSMITAKRGEARVSSDVSVGMWLGNAAEYRIALGDLAGARLEAREAIRLTHQKSWLHTAIAIQLLATIAALDGNPRRGARLRGYVDASFRTGGH